MKKICGNLFASFLIVQYCYTMPANEMNSEMQLSTGSLDGDIDMNFNPGRFMVDPELNDRGMSQEESSEESHTKEGSRGPHIPIHSLETFVANSGDDDAYFIAKESESIEKGIKYSMRNESANNAITDPDSISSKLENLEKLIEDSTLILSRNLSTMIANSEARLFDLLKTDTLSETTLGWNEASKNFSEYTGTLVYYDNEVMIYYDFSIRRAGPSVPSWPFKLLSDIWHYAKKTFGPIGRPDDSGRLTALFTYDFTHPTCLSRSSFAGRSSLRNYLVCPLEDDWIIGSYNTKLNPINHIGKILASSAQGMDGSPWFNLGGWIGFAQIFHYDVLLALGKEREAAIYAENSKRTYVQPVEGDIVRLDKFWFRDWYFPIYTQFGGTKVLNTFLELVKIHFPKDPQDPTKYERNMTKGEFIHFWSGAANAYLKGHLRKLLRYWTDHDEEELRNATITFKNIVYGKKV